MDKDKFLFSIIVPVYNVEKYIERCLDSIVSAIDIDCEVIIINDGSTDNCDSIIKKYIKSNVPTKLRDNFIYICKDNKGLSDTKNVGIEKSRGRYISFIDSDDMVSEDFYATARRYIKDDYDVIIYDLYLNFESDNKLNYVTRAYKDDFDGDFLGKIMMGAMLGSSCNKIIKRDLYKYKFPVGKQYEDVCVTPFILIDAKKIKYVPNPNYIYLQREKSIVSSNTLDGAFYKICSNLSDVLSDIGDYDKYKEIIYVFYLDRTIDMLDLSLKNERRQFLKNINKFYEKNFAIINYIIESDMLEERRFLFTKKQFSVLKCIYVNLYYKRFKRIKRVLCFRRFGKWLRAIFLSLKRLVKIIFGGIYD